MACQNEYEYYSNINIRNIIEILIFRLLCNMVFSLKSQINLEMLRNKKIQKLSSNINIRNIMLIFIFIFLYNYSNYFPKLFVF